jgi:hypothetical protein
MFSSPLPSAMSHIHAVRLPATSENFGGLSN